MIFFHHKTGENTMPENPNLLYVIMVCLTGVIGYAQLYTKRRSDVREKEIEAKSKERIAQIEAERIKDKAANERELAEIKTRAEHALIQAEIAKASATSIEAMSQTLSKMIEDRREGTKAIKENTEQMRLLGLAIVDSDKETKNLADIADQTNNGVRKIEGDIQEIPNAIGAKITPVIEALRSLSEKIDTLPTAVSASIKQVFSDEFRQIEDKLIDALSDINVSTGETK
jgi:hypothetical protein